MTTGQVTERRCICCYEHLQVNRGVTRRQEYRTIFGEDINREVYWCAECYARLMDHLQEPEDWSGRPKKQATLGMAAAIMLPLVVFLRIS